MTRAAVTVAAAAAQSASPSASPASDLADGDRCGTVSADLSSCAMDARVVAAADAPRAPSLPSFLSAASLRLTASSTAASGVAGADGCRFRSARDDDA